MRLLRNAIGLVVDTFLPRYCAVCKKPLDTSERHLCRKCVYEMPLTRFAQIPFNKMEQVFAGLVPIERATAYFYYEKSSPYSQILQDIKYRGTPSLGSWLAEKAARELLPTGFFNDIDYLIPVPLHRDKLAKRGYNQSEYIAQGISKATQIPIYQALEALKNHDTQTRKSATERRANIQGLYHAIPETTRTLAGRHILLIDDVITTGATLIACAEALLSPAPDALSAPKISIFTLSAARID